MSEWTKVTAPKNGEYYWIVMSDNNPDTPVVAHYVEGEFRYIDFTGNDDVARMHDISYFKHIEKPADREWREEKA